MLHYHHPEGTRVCPLGTECGTLVALSIVHTRKREEILFSISNNNKVRRAEVETKKAEFSPLHKTGIVVPGAGPRSEAAGQTQARDHLSVPSSFRDSETLGTAESTQKQKKKPWKLNNLSSQLKKLEKDQNKPK